MKKQKFPPGWDAERALRVADYYENQTDDEAIAEDEAPWQDPHVTMMPVPTGLVQIVRDLIEKERSR